MSKDQKVHHRQYGPTIVGESQIMTVNLRCYVQLYWIFISFWDCSFRISVQIGSKTTVKYSVYTLVFFLLKLDHNHLGKLGFWEITVYFTHLDRSDYTKLIPCFFFFSWTDFVKWQCHTKVTLKSWREKLFLGTKKREQRISSWPVPDSTIIELY